MIPASRPAASSLEDATSQRSTPGNTLTVILTQAQQDELADMDTPQLDIEQDAVFDMSGNPVSAAPDQLIIINDHTPPEIVSAEYDSPRPSPSPSARTWTPT